MWRRTKSGKTMGPTIAAPTFDSLMFPSLLLIAPVAAAVYNHQLDVLVNEKKVWSSGDASLDLNLENNKRGFQGTSVGEKKFVEFGDGELHPRYLKKKKKKKKYSALI
eukprot:Polyplicarium_translucidae@DN214_c0_g1_i2.p1